MAFNTAWIHFAYHTRMANDAETAAYHFDRAVAHGVKSQRHTKSLARLIAEDNGEVRSFLKARGIKLRDPAQ